jgi:RNA polymerase sigma-70 factor (ECF subfamily)
MTEAFPYIQFPEQEKDAKHYLEQLFRTHYASLCRMAFRYTRDKDQAEDIVQGVFLKVWEKRKQIIVKVSWKAYLYKACASDCLKYMDKNKSRTSLEDLSVHPNSHQPSDVDLRTEELRKLIQKAILDLTPACREVFLLSREEEMSNKEIAAILDISIKTVENQMTKALKSLRQKLGEAGYNTFLLFF